MSRLHADGLLLLIAIIWGFAFVAQKTGMDGIGPFGFIAARFALSLLVVMPFALRERAVTPLGRGDFQLIFFLCATFFAGATLQQLGVARTSVTNAGFLTGLYVLGVPLVAWALSGRPPPLIILPACLLAVLGIWWLNGASLSSFGLGDWMVLACAACFSIHVPLLGVAVRTMRRPLALSALQYAVCFVLALAGAFAFEGGIDPAALHANATQILYAGLLSGGIAYTLQAVAQQHTPSSDAAVIMAAEALFAALAGALLLGERLTGMGVMGCVMILAAILLVEGAPLWNVLRRDVRIRQNEGQN